MVRGLVTKGRFLVAPRSKGCFVIAPFFKGCFVIAPLLLAGFVTAGCANDPVIQVEEPTTTLYDPELSDSEFVDSSGMTEVSMDVKDNTFVDDLLIVSEGTTITFTNVGRNDHNIVSADGKFTQIEQDDFKQGDVVQLTFDSVGDYLYYCSIHGTPTAGQNGVVRVIE